MICVICRTFTGDQLTLLLRDHEGYSSSSARILLKIRNGQQSVIAQLNVIEERLEKLSTLEDSTDEIKANLAELKGMRAEVQSLKESVERKKQKGRFLPLLALSDLALI